MRIAQKNDNSFSCCSGFPGKILISFRGRGAGGKTRRVRLSLAPFFLPVSCPLLCPRRKNRVMFFFADAPFFWGKSSQQLFPPRKGGSSIFYNRFSESQISLAKRKEKVKFFGVRSIYLPRKTLSFSCSGILLSVVLL